MSRTLDYLAIFSAFFANIFLVFVFSSASKEPIGKKSGINSYFILEKRLRDAEKALNASERNLEIFKKFIERAKLGFGFADLKGDIIYANPTLCYFLNEKSPETAKGKNVVNFYPKDFQEKLQKDILPYVLKNENWIGEIPLRSNKDKITPTIQNIFLIKNDLGEPEYFANVLTDITERKNQEEILRKSEEKFKNIAERSSDVIVLTSNDGKINYISPYVSKVFGFSQEECIGKFIHKFLVKSDIGKISRDFSNSIQNKTYVENISVRMNHRNGSLIYADISLTPIIKDGEVNGIQGLIKDITQNKIIEKKLREREERYRSMFDSPINLVYISDFKGNFIDANRAALDLLGYTKEDIRSLKFSDLIDKKQLFNAYTRIREIQKKGFDIEPLEFKLKCKNGSYIYVETISSIINKDGKPFAIQGIGHDITERKKAEADVKKAHEKLSQMNKELERKVKERTARP
jgi:PAS domain S-box-containing protein